MRIQIYNALVNRKPGISYRYHKFHDGSTGFKKVLSWFYLLWLNFAYCVLFCRSLGNTPQTEYYEEKSVPACESESSLVRRDGVPAPSELVSQLKAYDVISFDVFDTLIFRPFSDPTDLFYLVGEKMGIQDFKNLRIQAEKKAREIVHRTSDGYEVTLEQIWNELADETGLDADEGIRIETETEKNLCFVNPYMLQVWNELKDAGKKLIIVSDMYLPAEIIKEILEKNGFTGAESIYISNELGCNKYEGRLYGKVLEDIRKELPDAKVIHVGDNPRSDLKMAEANGFDTVFYPNVNRNQLLYRPFDMSAIVGGAYRGIVGSHIYNGLNVYSREYEYGFIYGGLFVLGYCKFIHDYFLNEKPDKLLFLSRDGDILKKIYDYMYPGEPTEYVLWSRKAALKLMAGHDKHDYFRRFIDHKVSDGISLGEAIDSMELQGLKAKLGAELKASDRLTSSTACKLKAFLSSNWDEVLSSYEDQQAATKSCFTKLLNGCSKAVCIDIGWAGSGALSFSFLAERVWNIPCEITGLIAGTNTPYNTEPDASEPFLQSGKLKSYMFSQANNRDLLKKHDPAKGYNIFWELLLASPNPCFEGYYPDGPHFGDSDIDAGKAEEIQKGITDFVHIYTKTFESYPYMLNISGRDAYAPVLAASGKGEKYLRSIASGFAMEIGVK